MVGDGGCSEEIGENGMTLEVKAPYSTLPYGELAAREPRGGGRGREVLLGRPLGKTDLLGRPLGKTSGGDRPLGKTSRDDRPRRKTDPLGRLTSWEDRTY